MRQFYLFGAAFLTLGGMADCQASRTHYPRNGFVPDAQTAVQIAKAVGGPLFGSESIRAKAFKATLDHGVWTVYGNSTDGVGDTAVIKISKKTGAIIRVALAIVVPVSSRSTPTKN